MVDLVSYFMACREWKNGPCLRGKVKNIDYKEKYLKRNHEIRRKEHELLSKLSEYYPMKNGLGTQLWTRETLLAEGTFGP